MAESRLGTAIDSALAVRGARLAILLLVPFLTGAGTLCLLYFEHQSNALQRLADGQEKARNELTSAQAEVQKSIGGIATNVSVLSYKLDDQSRRIDQQGEWLKGQGADIKDLQKQVYPLLGKTLIRPREP
jgi:peptidoglycan hydrolase CwlO-like protein